MYSFINPSHWTQLYKTTLHSITPFPVFRSPTLPTHRQTIDDLMVEFLQEFRQGLWLTFSKTASGPWRESYEVQAGLVQGCPNHHTVSSPSSWVQLQSNLEAAHNAKEQKMPYCSALEPLASPAIGGGDGGASGKKEQWWQTELTQAPSGHPSTE